MKQTQPEVQMRTISATGDVTSRDASDHASMMRSPRRMINASGELNDATIPASPMRATGAPDNAQGREINDSGENHDATNPASLMRATGAADNAQTRDINGSGDVVKREASDGRALLTSRTDGRRRRRKGCGMNVDCWVKETKKALDSASKLEKTVTGWGSPIGAPWNMVSQEGG